MEEVPQPETRTSRAALGFVLVTILLDALSFGIIFPILPQLVIQLSAGDESAAARAFGWMAAGWSITNLFGAPVLGTLSDRFGRRPVILISAAGFSLDLAIMALATTLPWLFIGRMLTGLTAAAYSASAAYISDITPADDRARRFGLMGGVYGAGLILGPAIGGLLGEISPRLPFAAAAGFMALSWLYGLMVLPESLPPERRAKVDWTRANPLGSLGLLARKPGLAGLATVSFLSNLGAQAVNTLFVLYTAHRYGWGPAENGLILMCYSGGTILVMSVIAPQAVRRLGERRTVLLGLTLALVGFTGLGLAPDTVVFCLASVPTCLSNMAGPAMGALQTRRVEPTEYGRLQGAMGSLVALTGLVGPVAFTQIFAWSTAAEGRGGPGLALLLGAVVAASTLTIAVATATEEPKPLFPPLRKFRADS